MPESRWSQRVTTEDGVIERRRLVTPQERAILRKSLGEREEGIFRHLSDLLLHRDIPSIESVLRRHLQKLQETFENTAQRKPVIVQRFFARYLLQVTDIDEAAEALTSISYRDDEELHDFITVEPGTAAFEKARHVFIAEEASNVLMEGFISGHGGEFQTEAFIARIPEMMRVYRNWIESKRESLLQQSELARERFRATSKELIEQGLLPIDDERVERRLEDLRVEVLDPFIAETEELWGEYDAKSHAILLDIHVPEEAFYHVFVHEVMHAISGKTEELNSIYFDGTESKELDPNTALYLVPRSGISMHKMETDIPKRVEYTWLNEAMTELCAELFSHQTLSYKRETALLRLLIELGLPWGVLSNAYFADDDLHSENTHLTPHVRELFTESKRIFGKRFLSDMNLIIESQPTKVLRTSVLTRLLKYGEAGASALAEAVSEEAWAVRRNRQSTIQQGV